MPSQPITLLVVQVLVSLNQSLLNQEHVLFLIREILVVKTFKLIKRNLVLECYD